MYDARINIPVTKQTRHFVESIAERQGSSVADIARQALREYLDKQEDIIGSRRRQSRQLMSRLDELEKRLLERQVHADTLLLAAIILLRMKQGEQGNEVLEQIEKLVAYAGREIRVVLEAEKQGG